MNVGIPLTRFSISGFVNGRPIQTTCWQVVFVIKTKKSFLEKEKSLTNKDRKTLAFALITYLTGIPHSSYVGCLSVVENQSFLAAEG